MSEIYSKVDGKLSVSAAVTYTAEEIAEHIKFADSQIASAISEHAARLSKWQAEKATWESRKAEADKLGIVAAKVVVK